MCSYLNLTSLHSIRYIVAFTLLEPNFPFGFKEKFLMFYKSNET